jgi:hypothetical protein
MENQFDRLESETVEIKRISKGGVILKQQFFSKDLKVIETKLGKLKSKELDLILTAKIVIVPTGDALEFFREKYC